jgi:hypothetical protein
MSRVYTGMPGHFIAARQCCHHITTRINGKWLVSTVGCYHPLGHDDDPAEPIGYKRMYETMVFAIGEDGEISDWSELECKGYQGAEAADAGHEALCQKYEVRS